MKKITALSVLLALMANITVFAQFNTLKSSDGNYEYTDCGLKVNDGTGDEVLPFEDVVKDEWYFPYIYIAYSFGILNGKSENTFEPNAGMTCAEAVKIAACIHEYMTDYRIDTDSGSTWYEPYFQHCRNTGIIDDYIYLEPNKEITRAQMAYLFARCDVQPYEINPDVPLTDIPDVHDTTAFAYEILELYRRGIAVGSDEYMNFYPDAQVKRSEAAAFISRILCTDMRIGLPKG